MEISKANGNHSRFGFSRPGTTGIQAAYLSSRSQLAGAGWLAGLFNIRTLRLTLPALALVGMSGCFGIPRQSPATDSTHETHPLVGKIWSTRTASYIDPDDLADAIAAANYVLLGEVHDNPVHHQLQAQLIAGFPGAPHSVTVGFEQVEINQAEALTGYLRENPGNASDLGTAIAWSKSGWPDWSLYEPVFQQTLDRGWRPVPLMFGGERNKAVLETGFGAVLDENALAALQPDTALSREQIAETQAVMRSSHCDRLPDEYLPGMVTIQIARDAHMAWKQFESGPRGILIVGDGHARKDRGIPLFLRKLEPGATVIVISMAEVVPDLTEPAEYQQAQQAYSDYVMFTKRQERDDPCASI